MKNAQTLLENLLLLVLRSKIKLTLLGRREQAQSVPGWVLNLYKKKFFVVCFMCFELILSKTQVIEYTIYDFDVWTRRIIENCTVYPADHTLFVIKTV